MQLVEQLGGQFITTDVQVGDRLSLTLSGSSTIERPSRGRLWFYSDGTYKPFMRSTSWDEVAEQLVVGLVEINGVDFTGRGHLSWREATTAFDRRLGRRYFIAEPRVDN